MRNFVIFSITTTLRVIGFFTQKIYEVLYTVLNLKHIIAKMLKVIAIYLPPEKVSFIDPRSTMYFLAEELHDEAKYVFFARGAQRRGQKWNIWPRSAATRPKNT